jgi:transposase
MERRQLSMKVAGIDVGKRKLDTAVQGLEDLICAPNTEAGFSELIGWLRAREVGRVGLEATGGYERGIRAALEDAGFEVVVHQPLEIMYFGKMRRRRIKNDKEDARLIAAATAQVDAVKAAQDPRLRDLAERLTAYEQVTDQIVELKTFMESVSLKDIARLIEGQIRSLLRLKTRLAADILTRIRTQADLLTRFRLLLSLPGVGPIVAASLVIRMPELGSMSRGQAAALLGTAPYDRDSGQWKGKRFISGGRARPPQDDVPRSPPGEALQPNLQGLLRPSAGPRQAAKGDHRRGHAEAHRSGEPHPAARSAMDRSARRMNMVAQSVLWTDSSPKGEQPGQRRPRNGLNVDWPPGPDRPLHCPLRATHPILVGKRPWDETP